jgi:hypothetical protein
MRLRRRIDRLATRAKQLPEPAKKDWDADEWLAGYEAWGKEGYFDAEPDFPVAMAAYRQALAEAKACPDRPLNGDLLVFPAAFRAWKWLTGMLRRRLRGEAPVTIREFDELALWFERNAERMPFNQSVDLGDGRKVDRTNLRYSIQHHGVMDVHSGELVKSLRRLREVMGVTSPRTDVV